MLWKQPAPTRYPPSPDGLPIYVVGDIHGRADLVVDIQTRIDHDCPADRPHIEIYLGDYVDRGPQSNLVIDLLEARREDVNVICLKGNHEVMLAAALNGTCDLKSWFSLGGMATLTAYGVSSTVWRSGQPAAVADALDRCMPTEHRQFLATLPTRFDVGDYMFVHAGVRPGVDLDLQRETDLLWIRDEFLNHRGDFGRIIIHGHTQTSTVDFRPNRINLDTGAYASGKLSCIRIDERGVEQI